MLCFAPTGEARKCDCFSFLVDKPNIIDLVARAMKTYVDLDKLSRNFVLSSKQRYVNRLTVRLKIVCNENSLYLF